MKRTTYHKGEFDTWTDGQGNLMQLKAGAILPNAVGNNAMGLKKDSFRFRGTSSDYFEKAGQDKYQAIESLSNLQSQIGTMLNTSKSNQYAIDNPNLKYHTEDPLTTWKKFMATGNQYGGTPKSVLKMKGWQSNLDKLLDMQSRGDTGAYGKNVAGFNRAIEAEREKIARYKPEADAWEYYQSNLEKLKAGETAETTQTSGGFSESVSSFNENVQQFGQSMVDYGHRVLSFPKSRQFNPTGFIHTRKLTQ